MVRRKKTEPDYVENFFSYSVETQSRTIYIGSVTVEDDNEEAGVDFALSEYVLKGIHLLESDGYDLPINVILNCPGGNVYEGLAMYDRLKECKSEIIIKGYGKIWSMAGYLLQAGDKRLMSPNSCFMLHEGSTSLSGHPRIVDNWREYEKKLDKVLFNVYLEKLRAVNPKFPAKKLEEMLKFDTILSAEECVELGLADGIIDG